MAELELLLDQAIDRLNAGAEAGHDAPAELVDLARELRTLSTDDWPDHTFPDRLVDGLVAELSPAEMPRARPQLRRRRFRVGLGLAATAAVALAIAVLVALNDTPSVTAATLARRALAASSGDHLGALRFTQVITNTTPSGVFKPVPPPTRVVEHVVFGSPHEWRVEATLTEPHAEGTTTVLTVRNGDEIVSVVHSPTGTTETRRHAAAPAGLPSGSAYGAQIDPVQLLDDATGRCARDFAPVESGPIVAGRETWRLSVGPSPCPSADISELNGPATLLIDRKTNVVLSAELHAASGEVSQRVETRAFATDAPAPPDAFRLPAPLPKPATPSPSTAFTRVVPHTLPAGLQAGPVVPVATAPSSGKLLAFTVTYRRADGQAALELYEAAASTPSVRFPGRTVRIRPGLTGTYSDMNDMQILWWIENGTYVSLQQGGSAAGVPLVGTYSLAELVRLAGWMS